MPKEIRAAISEKNFPCEKIQKPEASNGKYDKVCYTGNFEIAYGKGNCLQPQKSNKSKAWT